MGCRFFSDRGSSFHRTARDGYAALVVLGIIESLSALVINKDIHVRILGS